MYACNRTRNDNVQPSKAPQESQAQSTGLFTSAAMYQMGRPEEQQRVNLGPISRGSEWTVKVFFCFGRELEGGESVESGYEFMKDDTSIWSGKTQE